jgi:hypothetical protein
MAMVVTSSLPQLCPSQLALSTAMLVLLQHIGVGLIPVAAVLWVLAVSAHRTSKGMLRVLHENAHFTSMFRAQQHGI